MTGYDYTQRSKVYCHNLRVEDIFEWFYKHVTDCGGDGGGALICENFVEAYEKFKKYVNDKYDLDLDKFCYQHKEDTYILISDGNENWYFTNDPDNWVSPFHEYAFIVIGKCDVGWDEDIGGFSLLPVKVEF